MRFQPGQGRHGVPRPKVVEAYLFLQSIADGQQREPGMREMLAAARVIDAMDRSCASGRWEEVADRLRLSHRLRRCGTPRQRRPAAPSSR